MRIAHAPRYRWNHLIRDLPSDVALFTEFYRIEEPVIRTRQIITPPTTTDHRRVFGRRDEPPSSTFRLSGRVIVDVIRACTNGLRRRSVRELSYV